jgi:hypothetical protein
MGRRRQGISLEYGQGLADMNQDKYFGFKGKFERRCIDHCYEHPSQESQYFLNMFKEAAERRNLESKR